VFYGLTGLHGLHVLAGLLLLLLVLVRFLRGAFDRNPSPHVLVTAAIWYWHFVDLVWLVLYLVVYIWGNAPGLTAAVEQWGHHQNLSPDLDSPFSAQDTPKLC
jgi:cytochrome b561